jgi:hypothetical protein
LYHISITRSTIGTWAWKRGAGGGKRASVTREQWNLKHDKGEHYIVRKSSRCNIREHKKIPRNTEKHNTCRRQAAPHAPREEARRRLRPMARGEKGRGRRRYPNRGRSGLHIVRGGGQPAQDVVRVSDMDGERNLSAPRGQKLPHVHPLRGGCLRGQLCQKAGAWPPRAPNSVTAARGIDADVLFCNVLSIIYRPSTGTCTGTSNATTTFLVFCKLVPVIWYEIM